MHFLAMLRQLGLLLQLIQVFVQLGLSKSAYMEDNSICVAKWAFSEAGYSLGSG